MFDLISKMVDIDPMACLISTCFIALMLIYFGLCFYRHKRPNGILIASMCGVLLGTALFMCFKVYDGQSKQEWSKEFNTYITVPSIMDTPKIELNIDKYYIKLLDSDFELGEDTGETLYNRLKTIYPEMTIYEADRTITKLREYKNHTLKSPIINDNIKLNGGSKNVNEPKEKTGN